MITFLISCLMGFAAPAHADLEWEQVMVNNLPGVEGWKVTTKNYLRGGVLRTEQVGSGFVRIMDLEKGVIWIINTDRQVYTELPLDRIIKEGRSRSLFRVEDVKAAIENMRETMESHMKDLPEEKKSQVRERLENQIKALKYLDDLQQEPQVERTEDRITISGFDCRLYRKFFRDTKVDVWIAEKGSLVEEYQRFSELLEEMGIANNNAGNLIPISQVEGFPMLTDSAYMKSEVTHLEEKKLEDAVFQVPAGYEKVEGAAILGGASE